MNKVCDSMVDTHRDISVPGLNDGLISIAKKIVQGLARFFEMLVTNVRRIICHFYNNDRYVMKKWKSNTLIHVSLTSLSRNAKSQAVGVRPENETRLDTNSMYRVLFRFLDLDVALIYFSPRRQDLVFIHDGGFSQRRRKIYRSRWETISFCKNSISNCLRHKLRILLFAVIVIKEKEEKERVVFARCTFFFKGTSPRSFG